MGEANFYYFTCLNLKIFRLKIRNYKKKLRKKVNLYSVKVKMNSERAAKLKQMSEDVRIGGKGSARRKKKVVHRTAASDDKKLQASLKKLMMNNIPGIEEVNMIRDDGHVIHFNNPKVQASLAANTFAITGHAETKLVTEILPQIINQLGPDSLRHLYQGGRKDGDLNGHPDTIVEDDEDVPELVDNFDAPSKTESKFGDIDDDVPPLVEVAAPIAEFIPPAAEPVAAPEEVTLVETAPPAKEATPPSKEATPPIEVAAPVVEAAPVAEVAAPVGGVAATVEEVAAPVEAAAPVEEVAAPAEEVAALVEEVAAPVAEEAASPKETTPLAEEVTP